MIVKIILFWLPMIALAFANATLRELIFVKHLNNLRAHQLSTLTLAFLCGFYIWIVFRFLPIRSAGQAFIPGGVWVVLTVLFEFSLGRAVNRSWQSLLADYNLPDGRIWIVFLLFLFFFPYLTFILRTK